MRTLQGKPLGQIILNDIRNKVSGMERPPVLGVVCSDRNQPYFKGIMRDAEFCGIKVLHRYLVDQVDGVISLDKDWVPPSELNLDGGGMVPCTAEAIMELLKWYNIPVAGKNVCVIGRSERVGRPLTNLLLDADATVTTCHSKTKDIIWHVMHKDIVISCVGNAGFNLRGASDQYMTVVDVGNDFFDIGEPGCLVPFIGGVGPVTRAILMRHVYLKAKWKES